MKGRLFESVTDQVDFLNGNRIIFNFLLTWYEHQVICAKDFNQVCPIF